MRRIVPLNLVGLGTTAADLARDLETASDGEIKIKVYGPGKLVPAEEIFPALEKGVIDATEFSMPAIDERLGLYKILKYNYLVGNDAANLQGQVAGGCRRRIGQRSRLPVTTWSVKIRA